LQNVIHSGGLHRWKYSDLIIGGNPVAVDTIGPKVINKKRKKMKLHTLEVKYLKLATGEGLGDDISDFIELIRETI
jgi:hypothetical protein